MGAVNFITGAGGFLQAVLFGYAGIRIKPEFLEFRRTGSLPGNADSIKIAGLDYLGYQFGVDVSVEEITFERCSNPGLEPLTLELEDGTTEDFLCSEFKLPKCSVWSSLGHVKSSSRHHHISSTKFEALPNKRSFMSASKGRNKCQLW